MNLTHRIAAGFALAAAPAVIYLGAATAHADVSTANSPIGSHQAFPHQHNTPEPGTPVHHHHQRNR
ncbi:hypothetical protein FZI85_19870 [Mycobacterium sp. CBMA293]|uniref:hypothetical protein n=1 Tax=unclassified Mycolicibacterium TaxID=2636767 RepID=UPI0012DD222E|nr:MULTISPECIES: hypothetical protein [unclassified Mycolicibacterium]MUL49046.1 hypothetical protein [Mycolicibacterium sp. CBMA 360]MUL60940.1 hypothetical protein [Mycolicibacterium sp. CBMA 335]MUL71953.1 hypothetical protein [Mycolicibacterium sp. CBMA 311]MUL95881.1 hypothetical protein [Mycolicibacterium sp. CBMA 230]MUM09024.1 hypothetical protein [Mycolicibacterium sp. CBMA 213]